MSNFLYGFQDPSMVFNSPVTPSGMNLSPVSRSVAAAVASRDPLSFVPDSHPIGIHHLHHHPHHHPHLTVRPTMSPAVRQRNIMSTMPPRLHSPTTTTPAPQNLYHSSASSSDDVHSLDLMRTYLHTDFGDTVLFKSWMLKSTWDTLLTCLAFFLLAILYEGIKCYREHLYKRLSFAVKKPVSVLSSSTTSTHNGSHSHHHHHLHSNSGNIHTTGCKRESSNHGHSSPLDPTTPSSLFNKTNNENSILIRLFSVPHGIQSLLHTIQAVLSYTLMLSFMTFNVYICLSIILGTGIGYFMFCWRRITVVHVSDCH